MASLSSNDIEAPSARDYLRPVFRWKWLILGLVVVLTTGAFVYLHQKATLYQSSTRLLLSQASDPLDPSATSFLDDRTVEDQATLITTREVARAAEQRFRGAAGASVSASANTGSNFITVTATSGDPVVAGRAANAYAQAFIALRTQTQQQSVGKAIAETQSQLNALSSGPLNDQARLDLRDTLRRLHVTQAASQGSATQVDPAVTPQAALPRHVLRNTALVALLALLGAVGLAFALEALNRRITRLDDFAKFYSLPVIGAVPRSQQAKFRHEDQPALSPAFTEPMRQLRTALELSSIDRPLKRILVTSAVAGEGKSTIVGNLAMAFREGGRQVAVVDMDLRRPTMLSFFGGTASLGLTDVLTGREQLEDTLLTVPVHLRGLATLAQIESGPSGDSASSEEIISLLPAGHQPADPQAVLSADRTHRLLDEVAERADIVLIDSPPLLHVTDAVALAPHVDAILIVARLGVVTRDNGQRLAELLDSVPGARPVGVVVNDVPTSEGHGYGYGYGYGYYGSSNGHA